jgi:uncharacterized repeat protein (TIGR03803 family)
VVLSGTTLYGTTSGPYPRTNSDLGGVFKINLDGSGFTLLKKFMGADGSAPWRELVLSGTTLYGVTREGGAAGASTVFRINTDGSPFRVLKECLDYPDGYEPSGPLVLSGSTLFGMTSGVGGSWCGNLFEINTDGSGFSNPKVFASGSGDGSDLYGGAALSGKTLFGTAVQGGIINAYDSYGCGTVFRINTDGSGFNVLHRFTGDEGMHPDGGVVVSGDTLYGTTDWLGFSMEPNDGTVFSVNSDGSDFKVLKSFTNTWSDGRGPDYLMLSGTTLYGVTWTGGASGNGTVFRLNTDGSGFNVLKHFTGSDGAGPSGHLLLSGTTLYGTAVGGGIANNGVVFALGFPPSISLPPQTQTAETGSVVCLSVTVAEPAEPLRYHWVFNDGSTLSDGTNAFLLLTNTQPSQAGAYTVIVTNLFGAATSSPALLGVIPPVPRATVPAISLTCDVGSCLHLCYSSTPGLGAAWQELGAVTLTTTPQFYADLSEPLASSRFYRAWQTNVPNVSPSLQLNLVTKLTLTGASGSQSRIDYINQFGPTDAWVALDTVSLTNTTQPYCDFTMFRKPARLYRLVPLP